MPVVALFHGIRILRFRATNRGRAVFKLAGLGFPIGSRQHRRLDVPEHLDATAQFILRPSPGSVSGSIQPRGQVGEFLGTLFLFFAIIRRRIGKNDVGVIGFSPGSGELTTRRPFVLACRVSRRTGLLGRAGPPAVDLGERTAHQFRTLRIGRAGR